MEYEHNNNYKGIAGAGLGLGIAGTALGVLAGGLNNVGLFGNNNTRCSEDHCVNRYEASQQARIAELETEVKLRDANTFTMGEMGKLRDYVDRKFACVEKEICDQKVYNATNNATINCIAGQVQQLMALTKLVIPNGSICPATATTTTTA